MGGYNTICEILASKKAALIIPRVTPRQEQLIRAERMQELGLVDVLHPKDLSPRTLRNWLASRSPYQVAGSRNGRPKDDRFPIDLQGLDRLPQLLQKLMDSPPRSKPDAVAETRLPKRSNPYAVI
jgi:predicted glycosyltransferase